MIEPTPVVVFGAGGHAAVVIEVIESTGRHRVAGVADDDPARHGATVHGHPIRAVDAFPAEWPVLIAIGDNDLRARVAGRLSAEGRRFVPAVAHARAVVSPTAELAAGTVVMPGAVVNARSAVGEHGIVNTGATIDHDCRLGGFVHVSPGAHLAGGIAVGSGTQIGIGANVIPGVTIGERAIIGAGAVVVRDVGDDATVLGNPARVAS